MCVETKPPFNIFFNLSLSVLRIHEFLSSFQKYFLSPSYFQTGRSRGFAFVYFKSPEDAVEVGF